MTPPDRRVKLRAPAPDTRASLRTCGRSVRRQSSNQGTSRAPGPLWKVEPPKRTKYSPCARGSWALQLDLHLDAAEVRARGLAVTLGSATFGLNQAQSFERFHVGKHVLEIAVGDRRQLTHG